MKNENNSIISQLNKDIKSQQIYYKKHTTTRIGIGWNKKLGYDFTTL